MVASAERKKAQRQMMPRAYFCNRTDGAIAAASNERLRFLCDQFISCGCKAVARRKADSGVDPLLCKGSTNVFYDDIIATTCRVLVNHHPHVHSQFIRWAMKRLCS